MMKDCLNLSSVMVVEDEDFSRRVLVKMLKEIGIEDVITAENGKKALEVMASREADIDLVISDIEMPEMNGYQFIRRLRFGAIPRYKDIPAIVMTGNDSEKNLQSGRILKITSFFVKPISKTILEKTIRHIQKSRLEIDPVNHARVGSAGI